MRCLLIISLMFVSIPVYSDPLFQRDSAEAAQLRRLYRQAEMTAPLTSYPVSRSILLSLAERLRESAPGQQENAAAYIDSIRPGDDTKIRIGARLVGTVRVATRNIQDYPTQEFARAYHHNPPYLTTQLFLESGDDFLISFRDERQLEMQLAEHANLPQFPDGNPFAPENNSIREGVLGTRLGPMEIGFGRQRIELSPSPFNSFAVSPQVPFLDALRITAPVGPLTMTFFTSTLENRRAANDVTIDYQNKSEELYDFGTTVIFFNLHYFEYHFGRVRLGIGSHVILAREMNEYHLADFFPVASWHNQNLTPNNHALIGDMSVTPLPDTELYVSFGLDDVYGESIGLGDDDTPTIYAFSAGGQGSLMQNRLSLAAEAGLTHYLWGSFDTGDELARAIYRMDLTGANRHMPLTSRHGPGRSWFITAIDFAANNWLSIEANAELIGSLPGAHPTTTPYQRDDELQSVPRDYTAIADITARIQPHPSTQLQVTPGVQVREEQISPFVSAEFIHTFHAETYTR